MITPQKLKELGFEVPPGGNVARKIAKMEAGKPEGGAGIRIGKTRKPNAGEQEYAAVLRQEFPDCDVLHEPFALRIPGGIYSPDIVVLRGPEVVLIAEVKGSRRLHSAGRSHLAFKSAALIFSMWRFRFAKKGGDGGWTVTDVGGDTSNRQGINIRKGDRI